MRIPENKKLLIFDYDGTIVDTIPSYTGVAVDVLCQHLDMSLEEAHEAYVSTIGRPFNEQIRLVKTDKDEFVILKALQEYNRRKNELIDTCQLFPEVETLIPKIQQHYKVAVVSSNTGIFVERSIARFNLKFSWVSGVGIYVDKASQILNCMVGFCVDKPETLYCGDSAYDEELAKTLGIDFVGMARYGEHFKSKKVKSLKEFDYKPSIIAIV